jgi:hypothetical protein
MRQFFETYKVALTTGEPIALVAQLVLRLLGTALRFSALAVWT